MTERREPRDYGYQQEMLGAARTARRVVTVPEADPASAWNTFAQRQERLRRERERVQPRPRTYVRMASRTFAQTGVRATSGRMRAVRRLPQTHNSPVPTRSGRRGRHSFFWRLLGLFSILIVVGLGTGFALTSNAFSIAQVNVTGTHSSALIASIQNMGIQGQNIFLFDVRSSTARIEANPLVASATLSRQLPNQMNVSIAERQPVLLWQTSQGSYSVDAHGVVIAPVSQTASAAHLFTVLDMRAQSKGQKAQVLHPGTQLNAQDIAFALAIFQQLPAVTGITSFSLRYENSQMADDAGSYTVVGPAGWLAYLGNAQDTNPLQNRLIELQAILSMAQQQRLTLATIDLRDGLHPVYTLKS